VKWQEGIQTMSKKKSEKDFKSFSKPTPYIVALALAIREVKSDTKWRDIFKIVDEAQRRLKRRKQWTEYID
jgi:hypothetical protein